MEDRSDQAGLAVIHREILRLHRKPQWRSWEYNELLSLGWLGWIKALRTYDRDKSRFASHAGLTVKRAIEDGVRQMDGRRVGGGKPRPLLKTNRVIKMAATEPGPLDQALLRELPDWVRQRWPATARVALYYFLEGDDARTASRKAGCCHAYLSVCFYELRKELADGRKER